MLGYVIDIIPSTKWGRLLYAVKIVIMDLSSVIFYNVEELSDWLWYGSAVTVEISRVKQENNVKLVIDDLSPNEYESPLKPVPINVLSYDSQTGELTLKRDDGRILTLIISEEHIKNEILATSDPNFYALFLDKPSGLKMIGLVHSLKYKLLNRAKELASSFISQSLEHNLCKM